MEAATEQFLTRMFANQDAERKRENKQMEEERKKDHKQFKEEIHGLIKEGIQTEVEAATKPMKESQEKIVKDQEEMLKTVQELARKVSSLEKVKHNENEFPDLEQPQGIMKQVTGRRSPVPVNETMTRDQEAVRKLFRASNLTLGLSPISQEILEAEVNEKMNDTEDEREVVKAKVMKEAVKEYLMMEMKIKEEHFDKLDIVRIFAPQKTNWNTVYMVLESQEQVDWVMSHTRWIPAVEKGQVQAKVMKYIPRQLYNRWDALQSYAFKIRRESNWNTQTKIGHGKDDFFLQTRIKGEKAWGGDMKLPETLPKIELEFLSREARSPTTAPGREKYKSMIRTDKRKDRPSNSSSESASPPPKQLNNGLDESNQFQHLNAANISSRKK